MLITKKIITSLFLLLVLCLNLFYLFPLYWMISTSVRDEAGGISSLSELLPKKLTLKHFTTVWAEGPFACFTFNSVLVTFCIVILNLIITSMAGYAFARKEFRYKNFLFIFLLFTLMVPRQLFMIPLFLQLSYLRLIDTYWALILPFAADAFNIFLCRQYLMAIPDDMEEAARVDGASEWQVFKCVVLPIMRPILAVVAINTAVVNWNRFLMPFILTTTEQMRTLPVGLALYAQSGQYSVDWGRLMAGSTITSLPLIIFFLVFQRQIISGITQGALKG